MLRGQATHLALQPVLLASIQLHAVSHLWPVHCYSKAAYAASKLAVVMLTVYCVM